MGNGFGKIGGYSCGGQEISLTMVVNDVFSKGCRKVLVPWLKQRAEQGRKMLFNQL